MLLEEPKGQQTDWLWVWDKHSREVWWPKQLEASGCHFLRQKHLWLKQV